MKKKRPTKKTMDTAVLSRRIFLGALGVVAGTIIGCEALQSGPIMENLPDGGDESGLPPLPPSTVKPPVANPVAAPDGIIPRSSWTVSGPIMSRITPMNGIQRITFHHSGDSKPFTSTDAYAVAKHLEAIRQYHSGSAKKDSKGEWLARGWGDIAYHYGIDPAGRAWALRPVQYQGSHVEGQNPHNLGVVVLGNFNMQQMTHAAQQRVIAFATQLRKQYKVPANRVYTHQEIGNSDCPGKIMQAFMVYIRTRKMI